MEEGLECEKVEGKWGREKEEERDDEKGRNRWTKRVRAKRREGKEGM